VVDGRGGESEKERLDRNLIELLNELRVALPGVQVLFAFLLTVPFTQRFRTLTSTQEKLTIVGLAFLALAMSGVVLLIGTDSGVPLTFHSDSTWRELDYWVRVFGVRPMDAIRAATYWPAVHLKVDGDVGTVAEGKLADIIAVRGDVLTYIDRLQDVGMVIRRGVRYE